MTNVKDAFPTLAAAPLSRRGFLQVVGLAGAGFLIGCTRPGDTDVATDAEGLAELGPFIRIGTDNKVTVVVKHLDMGQGVTTGLPTIVAEELDAGWSQMEVEFAPADTAIYKNLLFGFQGTGGSTSIANSWMQLRQAAAGARAMLVAAAAARWGVDPSAITVDQGNLTHAASGNEASFGDLALAAADIEPPAEPVLKDLADFRIIGTRVPRLDSPAKTDGTAVYGLDIERPGMFIAVVAHPPKFGATVRSFDPAGALEVPGVSDVVEIARGVAVVADSFFAAVKGRDALDVEWNFGTAETRGSDAMFADYEALAAEAGVAARDDGDAAAALGAADSVVRSEFHLPFLAHAPMEPLDCVVEVHPDADACEIWTGCQSQTADQYAAASILGLEPERVKIHTLFAGGSFGRRAVPDSDYVAEAVMVAKAIGGRAPVKLQWTREDDLRGGRYRPMSYHVLEGAVDDGGNITAWRHDAVIQSFIAGTSMQGMIQGGIDPISVEGAANLPYAIPNLRVDLHTAQNGVPTLWYRSVGHTQNGFVTEVFCDELAHAAGKDPFELRRELLAEHPRHLAVLELAAGKAGWGTPVGEGRGRGIAVHESFNSFVAEVVEVTVRDGAFSVDRVVCAVDCGIAINPDVVRAQMEGGIAFALSAALREEITLVDGLVEQLNFDSYESLRINEMPVVEVYIVQSQEAPTGVGEPGVPPLAPALVNALFAATGKRLHRLPIRDQLST